MIVELVYDANCPNLAETRTRLLRAFADLGLPARWIEWSRQDPASPPHARRFGSPTVLVDGRDVAGGRPGDGADCCRIYRMTDGTLRGAPQVEQIAWALAAASAGSAQGLGPVSRVGRRLLPVLPASVLTLIPVGKCPACWPVYGTLLGTLGLGFLLDARYLLPVTLLCLAAALFGLGFRARSRRGFAPLVLGVLASFLLVASKFFIQSAPGSHVAAALLLAAALWNAWPRRSGQVACPDCVGPSSLSNPWR